MTSTGDLTSPLPDAPVHIGLQGIYDTSGRLRAHELLFRSGDHDAAQLRTEDEHDRATAHVISSTFGEFGAHELGEGGALFINMTRSFLTGQLPIPFAPEGVVLELLENIAVDHELLEGLAALRGRGYQIAVDDFDGETDRLPALAHAQYVKIDIEVTGDRLDEVLALVRAASATAVIVVERVETQAQFDRCLSAGASLFQGYHLGRPVTMRRRALTTATATCVRLLAVLQDEEASTDEIVELISRDAALSIRVLRTVASSACAPRTSITSLHQAVALLGRSELREWVTLLLVSGATDSPGADHDALARIFARATALRLLVPEAAETAYVVGIFSGAAQVLALTPAELLQGCGVSATVEGALVRGEGVVGSALDALIAQEAALATEGAIDIPDGAEGEHGSPRPSRATVSRAMLRALAPAGRIADQLTTPTA